MIDEFRVVCWNDKRFLSKYSRLIAEGLLNLSLPSVLWQTYIRSILNYLGYDHRRWSLVICTNSMLLLSFPYAICWNASQESVVSFTLITSNCGRGLEADQSLFLYRARPRWGLKCISCAWAHAKPAQVELRRRRDKEEHHLCCTSI